MLTFVSFSTYAATDIFFTPVESYDAKNSGNRTIQPNDNYFPLINNAALISNSKIDLSEGSNIKVKYRINYDGTHKPENGHQEWVLVFNLGLHENTIDSDTRYIKEYTKNTNSIVFKIAPETIYSSNYIGRSKGNAVYSSYASAVNVMKVHSVPLNIWNELDISFLDATTIQVSINGKTAITYKGQFPSSAYISFAQDHTTIPFDLDRKMIINGEEYKAGTLF